MIIPGFFFKLEVCKTAFCLITHLMLMVGRWKIQNSKSIDYIQVRRQRPSLQGHRRHTVAGVRPASLPVNLTVPHMPPPQTEPIPVPSQKANYQQVTNEGYGIRQDPVRKCSSLNNADGIKAICRVHIQGVPSACGPCLG